MIISVNKIFLFLLYLLVFWVVVFPSGLVFFVNVKVLLLVLLLPFVILKLKAKLGFLFLICLYVGLILFWSLIGLSYDYPMSSVFVQSWLMLSTGVIICLFYLSIKSELTDVGTFCRFFVYAVVSYSLLKLLVIVLVFFGYMNIFSFLKVFKTVFHQKFITMNITHSLYRFELGNDIVLPLALYLVMTDILKFKQITRLVAFLVILLAVYFSFSRYIWAYSVCVFLLVFIRYNVCKKTLFIIFCFAVCLFAINYLSQEVIYHYGGQRFFSHAVIIADHTRFVQYHFLLDFWLQSPLAGHGIGSFVSNYIRNLTNPFSYELQWFSLLAQLGVIGMGLLLFYVMLPILLYWRKMKFSYSFGLISLYVIYLLAGFTNPILFDSQSAMVYAIVLILLGTNLDMLNEPVHQWKTK